MFGILWCHSQFTKHAHSMKMLYIIDGFKASGFEMLQG